MAKQEILNYLIKQKKRGIHEVDIPQLCLVIKINRTNISRACRTLQKDGDISVKKQKQRCFVKHMISLV